MIQGQFEPIDQCGQSQRERQYLFTIEYGYDRLIQRHPILLPAILIFGSVVLCVASLYADTVFPLLALIGVPTFLLCLAVALVLGISGIVVGIISILERLDRSALQTTTFPKPKGAL